MSDEAVQAAATKAQQHWDQHWALLEPVKQAIREALWKNRPATGIEAGASLDAAADLAAHAVVDHSGALTEAALAKSQALQAEQERDSIKATLPPAPVDVPAPMLQTAEPEVIRDWLKTATPKQLADALATQTDNARQAWASQMMQWVRADGNTADVIATLRAASPAGDTPVQDRIDAINLSEGDPADSPTEPHQGPTSKQLAGKENHPVTPGDVGAVTGE